MYDYIIVGAGSAGCVLAHRLSEDPACRVLLLEAGPRDWHPFIHMPAGLAKLVGQKGVNWNYDTAPEPHLENRRLWWPRGKVLGGSSSINAMCYIRGVPQDYDDWADAGAEGWDWNSVLPYFRRSERNSRGADALQAPKLIKMSGRGNLRKQIFQLSGRRLKPFVIYPQTMIAPGPFQTPAGIVQLSKNHRTRGGTAKLCIIRHPVLRPAKQHISAALSADPRQKTSAG